MGWGSFEIQTPDIWERTISAPNHIIWSHLQIVSLISNLWCVAIAGYVIKYYMWRSASVHHPAIFQYDTRTPLRVRALTSSFGTDWGPDRRTWRTDSGNDDYTWRRWWPRVKPVPQCKFFISCTDWLWKHRIVVTYKPNLSSPKLFSHWRGIRIYLAISWKCTRNCSLPWTVGFLGFRVLSQ